MTLDSAIFAHPEAKFLCMARDIAWTHHERYDGSGYPYGLIGDAIPLDFWEAGRARMEKIKPDCVMLSEGRRKADQLKAFDLDYSWLNFTPKDAGATRKQWDKLVAERPMGGAKFIRFVENHDVANEQYAKRIEKTWGGAKIKAGLVLCFTIDGVPMLYNGEEVADAARHSIFGRSAIDWASGETPNGKDRFAFCQKLCTMRRTEKALTHGDVVWLDNDQPKTVLSFLRCVGDEQIVTVINQSKNPVKVQVTLPRGAAASFAPLLSGKTTVSVSGAKASCEMGGYGYFVGKNK